MHSTITTTLLLISSSFIGLTHAADSVTFSALCFSPLTENKPALYVGEGSKKDKIEPPITILGGPFKAPVREGGFVDFYSNEQDEKPTSSVQLPSGTREKLLFLFIPKEKSFQCRIVSLPSKGFDGGSIWTFNAFKTDVKVHYGSRNGVEIKSGSDVLLPMPQKTDNGMVPVQIYSKGQNGQWQLAQSTRWPVDVDFRNYLFLYKSPLDNIPINIHCVPERLKN